MAEARLAAILDDDDEPIISKSRRIGAAMLSITMRRTGNALLIADASSMLLVISSLCLLYAAAFAFLNMISSSSWSNTSNSSRVVSNGWMVTFSNTCCANSSARCCSSSTALSLSDWQHPFECLFHANVLKINSTSSRSRPVEGNNQLKFMTSKLNNENKRNLPILTSIYTSPPSHWVANIYSYNCCANNASYQLLPCPTTSVMDG